MRTKTFFPIVFLAVLIAFFFLTSINCSNGITDSKEKLLPLQGKILFNIYPSPVLGPIVGYGDLYWLTLRTEQFYPCANMTIASNLIELPTMRVDPSYLVSIQGIQPQEVCLMAFGPASQRLELNIPLVGAALQFNYRNLLDTYRVSIVNSQIVVEPINSSFTVYQPGLFLQ